MPRCLLPMPSASYVRRPLDRNCHSTSLLRRSRLEANLSSRRRRRHAEPPFRPPHRATRTSRSSCALGQQRASCRRVGDRIWPAGEEVRRGGSTREVNRLAHLPPRATSTPTPDHLAERGSALVCLPPQGPTVGLRPILPKNRTRRAKDGNSTASTRRCSIEPGRAHRRPRRACLPPPSPLGSTRLRRRRPFVPMLRVSAERRRQRQRRSVWRAR